MSLLDTLPDDLADGGELAFDDNGLLQSLADVEGDPELSVLLSDLPDESQEDQPGERRAEAVAPSGATAQPKAKRRRRAVPKRDPEAGPLTRQEICRNAAMARWAKTKPAPQVSATAAGPSAPSASSAAAQPSGQLQIVLHASATECGQALVSSFGKALRPHDKGEQETNLRKAMTHTCSYTSIGKQFKLDRKTVQRKFRLQAATAYFASYYRCWTVAKTVYAYFQKTAPDFQALNHLLIQRFDEMQIVLRLSEVPADVPLWQSLSKQRERVTAKLLQVYTEHDLLMKAHGRHFCLELVMPTLLKPIESTHAECVSDVCQAQERGDEWTKGAFQERSRMTIADSHSSNGLSDFWIFMQDWRRALLRWLCWVHANHKVCEFTWMTFPAELRGLMSSTLLFRQGGQFAKWKRGAKRWIRAKARRRLVADEGPLDEESQAYRESLFKSFVHADDQRLSGPKARARQKRLFRKKRIYTGRLAKVDEIDHLCDGASCCADEETTLQAMEDDIEQEVAPEVWAQSRWLGSEEALNFYGFWLGCHGIFAAGFLIGIMGIEDLNLVLVLVIAIVHGEGESVSERPPEYSECTKEMTQFERQTTHINNTDKWLQSKPIARLNVLKPIHSTQQQHTKELLKMSGESFEMKQLELVRKGKGRQYRPVIAFDGTITKATLRRYGRMLVSEEPWQTLPVHFYVHSIAMAGYRAVSKAICSLAELELFRGRSYPPKYFSSLRDEPEMSLHFAQEILFDYEKQPCIIDFHTWHFAGKYRSPIAFCSPDHRAYQVVCARKSELDNAVTEAKNATIRRRVKMHVQQTSPEMLDVQSDWVLSNCTQQETSIFGDGDETSESETEDAPRAGGGGGRYHAWISMHKEELKDSKGKLDMMKCGNEYRATLAEHPESEDLKEAECRGRLGTIATRMRFEAGETNYNVSVFGTIRPRVAGAQEKKAQDMELLQDLDQRILQSNAVVTESGMQLAVVNQDPLRAVSDLVVARAGWGIQEQVATLDRLCRAVAARESETKRRVIEQLREFVEKSGSIGPVSFAEIPLPELGSLKVVNDIVPVVRYHDASLDFAAKKVEQITAEKGAEAALLLDQFERRSRMTKFGECATIPTVPDMYRPTYCFKYGAGTCLCSGGGIIVDFFRRKTSALTFIQCPAGSEARRLLAEGWLFLRLGQEDWVHCGLVYFNPRRITYLRVHLLEERPDASAVLQARLDDQELPQVLHETDLAKQLPLASPISMTVYKLMAWESAHVPFALGALLEVQPLDKWLSMACNHLNYWAGSEVELQEERVRRAQKAEKEKARRAAAAAKAAARPKPAAPPSAPQPKRQDRPRQAPPNAGLEALPIADAAPGAAAGASVVAPGVRLDVEGEEIEEAGNMDAPDLEDANDFPGGEAMRQEWVDAVRSLPGGVVKFRFSFGETV